MREAWRELPEEIRGALKNLAVLVEDLPRDTHLKEYQPPLDPCLFGLYLGCPFPNAADRIRPDSPTPSAFTSETSSGCVPTGTP